MGENVKQSKQRDGWGNVYFGYIRRSNFFVLMENKKIHTKGVKRNSVCTPACVCLRICV